MSSHKINLKGQERDANEREIINALTAVGVYAQQMDKTAGYDLMCAYHDEIELIEVKQEGKELTPRERHVFRMVGPKKYHIVHTVEEALAVFGLEAQ